MTPRRARRQSGYALLFVFALAAAVAFKIYLELPRVAFEAQRNKEDMLVERGEQYIRGIQLFVRKMGRYPQSVDELEKTNNIRFLRRRYKDPMTGEEEWRLVHVDASGALTDSLVHKGGLQGEEKKAPSVLANTIQGIGGSAEVITPGGGAQPAAALQRRASDRVVPGGFPGGAGPGENPENPPDHPGSEGTPRSGPAEGGEPPPPPGNSPFQPVPIGGVAPGTQPGYQPGYPPGYPPGFQPGMMPGTSPAMNRNMPGAVPFPQPGMGAYPGQPVNSQTGGMIGVSIGGIAAQAPQTGTAGRSGSFGGGTFGGGSFVGGQMAGGQAGGMSGAQSGFPQAPMYPGQPGYGQQGFGAQGMAQGMIRPGMTPGMPGSNQNPALQMINQILTGQRQNPNQRAGGVGGQNLGGGIAGVASKKDAEGIKIYKERTNYKEWEFLYDPKEDAMAQAAKAGVPGAAGNQATPNIPGVPSLNPPVQPGAQPMAPKPGPAFGFGRQ